MKTLELEQMEILKGGECGGQTASVALAWAGMFLSVATMNPIGLALSFTSMVVASENYVNAGCMD